jgi:acetyltransferase-like isoleucine patch superfamily enzyme
MLRHVRYLHKDATLVWDRARCELACEKYDTLLSLGPGVRDDQKRDSLGFILDPSLDPYYKPSVPLPRERGILSGGVEVCRGFSCSYGYNLKLMDHCFIDKNVTIDDAAKVEIGARSYIGAGTQIVTSRPVTELTERKGAATEREASDVVIESDVQVGAGCVIGPGVRLGKGCSIAVGMRVERDVEALRHWGPNEDLEMRLRLREVGRGDAGW